MSYSYPSCANTMEWSKLNNIVGDMEDLGRLDFPAGTRAEYGPSGESTLLEPDIVSICQELAAHEGFDSKKEFQKVVSKLKFKYKCVCKNSEIYRVYKLLEASGSIQHHPQLGFFLRTKVGKSSSGILSVTVFTSPYPQFVDPKTAFITMKTKVGKDLKALELPGLWNGSMAYWNTIFVEVPLITFNPVKTVTDLLKPTHQIK